MARFAKVLTVLSLVYFEISLSNTNLMFIFYKSTKISELFVLECIVRHNGCNCGNQDCNLGLTDFADSASFTLTVLSFKKFCYFFMRSADCIRMVEIKVASDDDFDGIDLIKIISDGAMKGLASLKKSLMLEEEACGGLADDLSSHSDDLEPTHSECTESVSRTRV